MASESVVARHIWVLRHAKAASDSPDGDDHSRPLTKRGRQQAVAAGQFLAEALERRMPVPQLVLCSSAARALQTAALVLPVLGEHVTLEVERALYQADVDDVIDLLRGVDDGVSSVMVIGHNPTFAELAASLVSDVDEADRERLESLPTCALAQIEVRAERWTRLVLGTGRLESFFVPQG